MRRSAPERWATTVGIHSLRLFLSLLLLCVLLEASARVYLHGLAGLDPRRVGLLKTVTTWDVIEVSPNPMISYQYKWLALRFWYQPLS